MLRLFDIFRKLKQYTSWIQQILSVVDSLIIPNYINQRINPQITGLNVNSL